MTNDDTDVSRDELQEQLSEQEETIEVMGDRIEAMSKVLPDSTRRRVLMAGGGAALFGAGAIGGASAAPGDDGDTVWGTETNRDDYYADEIDANDVNANNVFTDPAGVQHTGELADIDDVGDGGGSSNQISFSYSPGYTQWEDGLSNEVVNEIGVTFPDALESNFTLSALAFPSKDGTGSSNATLEVVEDDFGSTTVIDSTDLGDASGVGGTVGNGTTMLVRISNSTGSAITAAPTVMGYFE